MVATFSECGKRRTNLFVVQFVDCVPRNMAAIEQRHKRQDSLLHTQKWAQVMGHNEAREVMAVIDAYLSRRTQKQPLETNHKYTIKLDAKSLLPETKCVLYENLLKNETNEIMRRISGDHDEQDEQQQQKLPPCKNLQGVKVKDVLIRTSTRNKTCFWCTKQITTYVTIIT